jgi:lysophospholipase L1-like esterase
MAGECKEGALRRYLPPPVSRVKLLLGNLAVLAALLLLCALGGELWLRSVAQPRDGAVLGDGRTKWRFNPYQPDGVLGYVHRPDWETVHATDEFQVTVHTNALGLRGAPARAEKEPGTYRILVIGDSFAFGFGVADDETFPAVLGRTLAPPPGFRRVEVLNAGVAGWSADQYWLFLQTRGFALAPDLVLLALTENDPGDLAWNRLELGAGGLPVRAQPTRRMIDQSGRMRYLEGGPLALPSLSFPGQAWLADHSQLYHWLRFRIAKLWIARKLRGEERRLRAEAGTPPGGPIEDLAPGALQRALWSGPEFQIRYHRHLVAAIRKACAERGVALATLLVVFRPGQAAPESAAALAEDCAADRRCVPSSALLAGHDEAEIFFAEDGHWRARGHALVAEGLARWLAARPPWSMSRPGRSVKPQAAEGGAQRAEGERRSRAP